MGEGRILFASRLHGLPISLTRSSKFELPAPRSPIRGSFLAKLLWLIGSTVGGWIGWWLGDRFGLFAAVVLSAVGTGVGIYAARRIVAEHF